MQDDNEFLKKGWLDEGVEHVQSYVESVGNGWTANQVRFFLAVWSAVRWLMFGAWDRYGALSSLGVLGIT